MSIKSYLNKNKDPLPRRYNWKKRRGNSNKQKQEKYKLEKVFQKSRIYSWTYYMFLRTV